MSTETRETVEIPDWAQRYFAAADGFDIDTAVASFAEDARFTVGNSETVVGVQPGLGLLGELFGAVDAVSHRFWSYSEAGALSVLIADVTYTRKDGGVVTIPAVTAIERDAHGKFTSLQIVFDAAPVVS